MIIGALSKPIYIKKKTDHYSEDPIQYIKSQELPHAPLNTSPKKVSNGFYQ